MNGSGSQCFDDRIKGKFQLSLGRVSPMLLVIRQQPPSGPGPALTCPCVALMRKPVLSFAPRVSPYDAQEKEQMRCVSSDDQAEQTSRLHSNLGLAGKDLSFRPPSLPSADVTRAAGSRVVVGPRKLLPGQCRTVGFSGPSWGRGEAAPVRGRPGPRRRLSGDHGGGREGGGQALPEEPPQQLPASRAEGVSGAPACWLCRVLAARVAPLRSRGVGGRVCRGTVWASPPRGPQSGTNPVWGKGTAGDVPGAAGRVGLVGVGGARVGAWGWESEARPGWEEGLWAVSLSSWGNPGFSLCPRVVGDGKMPSGWRALEGVLQLLGGEIGDLAANP